MLRPMDALNVLCAQLTRDLFAIAKFLLHFGDRQTNRRLRRTDGHHRCTQPLSLSPAAA